MATLDPDDLAPTGRPKVIRAAVGREHQLTRTVATRREDAFALR